RCAYETALFCLFAIYLIAGALLEMFAVGKIRESGTERKQFVLESVISIVAAVIFFIILAKPETFIRIGGIIVIAAGLLFTLVAWKNRPLVQEPVEVVDDISGTIEKSSERP
ncbi:MAG: hypothetical protein K2H09_04380, partial [Treponemataceae bacterium]|nr:hypothetical protein [Treponemataceae bacterium]